MHRGNAGAHRETRRENRPGTERRPADEEKRDGGSKNGSEERKQNCREVVKNADGKNESEHADVVHGPDAEAHGEGAGADPDKALAALRGGGAGSEVERGICGENGNRDREEDKRGGVGVDEDWSGGGCGGVIHGVWPDDEGVGARIRDGCG